MFYGKFQMYTKVEQSPMCPSPIVNSYELTNLIFSASTHSPQARIILKQIPDTVSFHL